MAGSMMSAVLPRASTVSSLSSSAAGPRCASSSLPHSVSAAGCASPPPLSLRALPLTFLASSSPPAAVAASGGAAACAVATRASSSSSASTSDRLSFSDEVVELRGGVMGNSFRFGIVVALFNEVVTRALLRGALETLERHGVHGDHVEVAWVPGSFELPVVAQEMAKSRKFDAVICIGAVVRGSTTHYDAVANSAASGVLSASLNSGIPCIFGVLTCETMEQAIDRAGGKLGNKGGEAAMTAIEMASLMASLRARGSAALELDDE